MPRFAFALAAFALGWALACAGITDRLTQVVADQAARAIAENMGLPADQVQVAARPDGRWALTTPEWKANCGFGPSAERPEGFPFQVGDGLMGDCRVEGGCTEVLGVPCDAAGNGTLAVVFEAAEGSAAEAQERRKREMASRGWAVSAQQDPKNPKATILVGRKKKKVKGAVIQSTGSGGSTVQILVAPAR